ncbi:MAG TPA: carbon-nitrogen hydrolase family protein [Verrucomicrobiae bacterium]|jgi:predicted amidohydrolase|nr:carbon-nitrogen hydrolase family protein [Verrucomicrobiae bacterium]
MKLRVACIQNSAGPRFDQNLARSLRLAGRALEQSPQIIAYPENFLWRGDSSGLEEAARATPEAVEIFKELARSTKTAFLLGSVVEKSPVRGKYYNTSLFVSEQGKILAAYRKIHLFDIALKKKVSVKESRHTARGNKPAMFRYRGIKMGLSICYDLRFPELYRILSARGCRLVFVPSNFTHATGRAHWEVLLRARAVENQIFIAAPAQSGTNPATGIRSFGSTMMVSPWGDVEVRAPVSGEAVIAAEFDFAEQDRLRAGFPVLSHRRLKSFS